jgi:hypothetical protein
MNDQLGSDEDRKCNEESDLNFNVVKEGKPTGVCRGAEGGEEQQRQPCHQRDNEQPTMYEF